MQQRFEAREASSLAAVPAVPATLGSIVSKVAEAIADVGCSGALIPGPALTPAVLVLFVVLRDLTARRTGRAMCNARVLAIETVAVAVECGGHARAGAAVFYPHRRTGRSQAQAQRRRNSRRRARGLEVRVAGEVRLPSELTGARPDEYCTIASRRLAQNKTRPRHAPHDADMSQEVSRSE